MDELANVLSRVSYGERMTTLDIMNSFPNSDYPSRAELAQLMVTKFMDEFEPILYLQ